MDRRKEKLQRQSQARRQQHLDSVRKQLLVQPQRLIVVPLGDNVVDNPPEEDDSEEEEVFELFEPQPLFLSFSRLFTSCTTIFSNCNPITTKETTTTTAGLNERNVKNDYNEKEETLTTVGTNEDDDYHYVFHTDDYDRRHRDDNDSDDASSFDEKQYLGSVKEETGPDEIEEKQPETRSHGRGEMVIHTTTNIIKNVVSGASNEALNSPVIALVSAVTFLDAIFFSRKYPQAPTVVELQQNNDNTTTTATTRAVVNCQNETTSDSIMRDSVNNDRKSILKKLNFTLNFSDLLSLVVPTSTTGRTAWVTTTLWRPSIFASVIQYKGMNQAGTLLASVTFVILCMGYSKYIQGDPKVKNKRGTLLDEKNTKINDDVMVQSNDNVNDQLDSIPVDINESTKLTLEENLSMPLQRVSHEKGNENVLSQPNEVKTFVTSRSPVGIASLQATVDDPLSVASNDVEGDSFIYKNNTPDVKNGASSVPNNTSNVDEDSHDNIDELNLLFAFQESVKSSFEFENESSSTSVDNDGSFVNHTALLSGDDHGEVANNFVPIGTPESSVRNTTKKACGSELIDLMAVQQHFMIAGEVGKDIDLLSGVANHSASKGAETSISFTDGHAIKNLPTTKSVQGRDHDTNYESSSDRDLFSATQQSIGESSAMGSDAVTFFLSCPSDLTHDDSSEKAIEDLPSLTNENDEHGNIINDIDKGDVDNALSHEGTENGTKSTPIIYEEISPVGMLPESGSLCSDEVDSKCVDQVSLITTTRHGQYEGTSTEVEGELLSNDEECCKEFVVAKNVPVSVPGKDESFDELTDSPMFLSCESENGPSMNHSNSHSVTDASLGESRVSSTSVKAKRAGAGTRPLLEKNGDSGNNKSKNRKRTSLLVSAPPGKLDIIIASSVKGPVVRKVFPSSPLVKSVAEGDVIAAINDFDTRLLPASIVTDIMTQAAELPRNLKILRLENSENKERKSASKQKRTDRRKVNGRRSMKQTIETKNLSQIFQWT